MAQTMINRTFKDRLFRLAFQDKKDLLDLYNAVSNRAYTNPDDLIITTLTDTIYLGMKNDVSFLVWDVLNLYEHQGSFNPNMPVHGLSYFSETYRQFIEENRLDVYGSRLIRLPMPPVYYLLQRNQRGAGSAGASAVGCICVSESGRGGVS